jgi:hypothetical protein
MEILRTFYLTLEENEYEKDWRKIEKYVITYPERETSSESSSTESIASQL